MIDRYLLRYFLAVIDQGNFSKAATACHVSQPTLSVGIAKLEQMLGKPLFNRTNRRVELTDAGGTLSRHARRIEAEFALAERQVRGAAETTLLRLGVLSSIPSSWIAAFLVRLLPYAHRHRVEIVEGTERDLLDRLARGRVDVALTLIRPGETRYEREALLTEGYGLAISSAHALAGHAVIEAEELADNAMIVRRHCELLSDTSRFFTARGVRPVFTARTLSDDRALDYVRTQLGVTVMPDCFTGPGVVRPRLKDFAFEREIGLLYAAHCDIERVRHEAPVEALIATVREKDAISAI
jgi:DNA-binding transcriptional LysR family regulator